MKEIIETDWTIQACCSFLIVFILCKIFLIMARRSVVLSSLLVKTILSWRGWDLGQKLTKQGPAPSTCPPTGLTSSFSGQVCSSLAPVCTQSFSSSSVSRSSPARSSPTTARSTTTRASSPSCTCYQYFSSSTCSVTSSTSPPAAGATRSPPLTSKWVTQRTFCFIKFQGRI